MAARSLSGASTAIALEALAVGTLVSGGALRLTAEDRDGWSVVFSLLGLLVAAVVLYGLVRPPALSSGHRVTDALVAAGLGLTQLAGGLDAHHATPAAAAVLVAVGCGLVIVSLVRRPRSESLG